ncbi:hypothetical protein DCO57_17135 [Labrenzia sp. 011]|nr:hypothetical protein DCO57_17135 [Labrenzia sp. 011]
MTTEDAVTAQGRDIGRGMTKPRSLCIIAEVPADTPAVPEVIRDLPGTSPRQGPGSGPGRRKGHARERTRQINPVPATARSSPARPGIQSTAPHIRKAGKGTAGPQLPCPNRSALRTNGSPVKPGMTTEDAVTAQGRDTGRGMAVPRSLCIIAEIPADTPAVPEVIRDLPGTRPGQGPGSGSGRRKGHARERTRQINPAPAPARSSPA